KRQVEYAQDRADHACGKIARKRRGERRVILARRRAWRRRIRISLWTARMAAAPLGLRHPLHIAVAVGVPEVVRSRPYVQSLVKRRRQPEQRHVPEAFRSGV